MGLIGRCNIEEVGLLCVSNIEEVGLIHRGMVDGGWWVVGGRV
jgi:hypothetical protein